MILSSRSNWPRKIQARPNRPSSTALDRATWSTSAAGERSRTGSRSPIRPSSIVWTRPRGARCSRPICGLRASPSTAISAWTPHGSCRSGWPRSTVRAKTRWAAPTPASARKSALGSRSSSTRSRCRSRNGPTTASSRSTRCWERPPSTSAASKGARKGPSSTRETGLVAGCGRRTPGSRAIGSAIGPSSDTRSSRSIRRIASFPWRPRTTTTVIAKASGSADSTSCVKSTCQANGMSTARPGCSISGRRRLSNKDASKCRSRRRFGPQRTRRT